MSTIDKIAQLLSFAVSMEGLDNDMREELREELRSLFQNKAAMTIINSRSGIMLNKILTAVRMELEV